jgi:hypothetical protein
VQHITGPGSMMVAQDIKIEEDEDKRMRSWKTKRRSRRNTITLSRRCSMAILYEQPRQRQYTKERIENLTREGLKQRMPKSGMMAKPMTTSRHKTQRGRTQKRQVTTRSLGSLYRQKSTILLLKDQRHQDIAAEGLAPPKWTAPLVWVAKKTSQQSTASYKQGRQ